MSEQTRIPDPTTATTAQTLREIESLKELLLSLLDAQEGKILTRIEAMDRAIRVFSDNLTRVPTDVDKQVGALREFFLETFKAVDQRFDGMDKAIELVRENHLSAVESLGIRINKCPIDTESRVEHLRVLTDEKFLSVKESMSAVKDGIQKQFEERDTRTDQTSRDSKLAIDAALQAAKEAVGKSETSTVKQIDQQGLLIQSGTKATDDKIDDIKSRLQRIEGIAVGQVAAVQETRAGSTDARGTIALAISAGMALLGVMAFVLAQRGGP